MHNLPPDPRQRVAQTPDIEKPITSILSGSLHQNMIGLMGAQNIKDQICGKSHLARILFMPRYPAFDQTRDQGAIAEMCASSGHFRPAIPPDHLPASPGGTE